MNFKTLMITSIAASALALAACGDSSQGQKTIESASTAMTRAQTNPGALTAEQIAGLTITGNCTNGGTVTLEANGTATIGGADFSYTATFADCLEEVLLGGSMTWASSIQIDPNNPAAGAKATVTMKGNVTSDGVGCPIDVSLTVDGNSAVVSGTACGESFEGVSGFAYGG